MTIQWWQILLITIYAGFAFYDGNNTTFGTVKPTMAGFFAGLVLGDVTTGLVVGGTLNLLVLGIGNFGGASIPGLHDRRAFGNGLRHPERAGSRVQA